MKVLRERLLQNEKGAENANSARLDTKEHESASINEHEPLGDASVLGNEEGSETQNDDELIAIMRQKEEFGTQRNMHQHNRLYSNSSSSESTNASSTHSAATSA